MTATRGPRFSLLCFGFVVCGIVTVLPGPLLPVFAARWGLPDVQAGAFFAAEFAASTVGSIFSPHWLRRNLPLGYGAMTAGVLLLILAGQTQEGARGHTLALMGFALIGLGTGLSVTATNLTVSMMGERAGGRAQKLSIVNLGWGMGAVACPWMLATSEHTGHLADLLLLAAAATAGMFVALFPLLRETPNAAIPPRSPLSQEAGILGFFSAFLFLYVGVETVVSGWITTYAHRFSGMTVERASLMVSVFWLALLAGRGAGSLALRRLPERAVLVPCLALSLAALATLVARQSTTAMVAAVAVTGAGFGPVFPVGVSRMLAHLRDHRNTGWVFAMCASGGAVLPWVTGLVSTGTGSLRVGFAVPAAALAALLLLAAAEKAVLRPARQRS